MSFNRRPNRATWLARKTGLPPEIALAVIFVIMLGLTLLVEHCRDTRQDTTTPAEAGIVTQNTHTAP